MTRSGVPDRCAPASLSNRLHFALATLRSLGLRSVLMRREDGYFIDPSVTIDELGPDAPR